MPAAGRLPTLRGAMSSAGRWPAVDHVGNRTAGSTTVAMRSCAASQCQQSDTRNERYILIAKVIGKRHLHVKEPAWNWQGSIIQMDKEAHSIMDAVVIRSFPASHHTCAKSATEIRSIGSYRSGNNRRLLWVDARVVMPLGKANGHCRAYGKHRRCNAFRADSVIARPTAPKKLVRRITGQ